MLEDMVEIVQLSAAEANRRPKKSSIYPMRRAPMPYTGQSLTEGRKAIRDLVENQASSNLGFQ